MSDPLATEVTGWQVHEVSLRPATEVTAGKFTKCPCGHSDETSGFHSESAQADFVTLVARDFSRQGKADFVILLAAISIAGLRPPGQFLY